MQWLKDRALAIMLLIGGCAALAITIALNRHFGVQQAATSEGQMLSGSMTVFIDVALVLLGITSGALWRSKDRVRKAVGGFTFLLMLACALASVTSVLGFLGAERLSVSKAREKAEQLADARHAADAAANKEKLDAQIALAKENAKWMQTQTAGRGIGRAERKDLRRDMMDGMNKSVEVIGKATTTTAPEKPSEILLRPDGQVELIADITGINKQTLQLTILAYMSVLLIVLKSSFFPLGAFMWGTKAAGLPASVTDPIRHGMPEEAHVTLIPAPEPPAGQRMLPAPISRPEPPPEGKIVLARIGFPRVKPDGEARAMTDEERETVGIRMLTFLTAHGVRGDFAQDKLWELFKEFFAAQNVAVMAERHAKPALASVNKGRKYYATSEVVRGQGTVWTVRIPDFEELHGLLDKAGFPAAPKAGKSKASPTKQDEPVAEEAAPDKGVAQVASRPFSSGTETPKRQVEAPKPPLKGLAELQRFRVDIDAMRALAREQKQQFQARMWMATRKQKNRMRMMRVA